MHNSVSGLRTSLGVFTRDAIFHPVPEDFDFSAPVSLARLEYRPDGRVLYRGNYHRRRY